MNLRIQGESVAMMPQTNQNYISNGNVSETTSSYRTNVPHPRYTGRGQKAGRVGQTGLRTAHIMFQRNVGPTQRDRRTFDVELTTRLNTHPITAWIVPIPDPAASGSHLSALLDQLYDVKQSEEESIRPTLRAETRIKNLLLQGASNIANGGDLYGDACGGLRLEWIDGMRELCLIVDAAEESDDYIYWRDGESHDIEAPVTEDVFNKWLRWWGHIA